jgi:hypothetical protein
MPRFLLTYDYHTVNSIWADVGGIKRTCNKCNRRTLKFYVEVFNKWPTYEQFDVLFFNNYPCKTF